MAGSAEPTDSLIARVRSASAIGKSALKWGKLDPAAQASLRAALEAAGLELTEKHARVPLAEQLERVVRAAEDRGLPLPQLTRAIKGAQSGVELRAVIDAQIAAGAIALVTDGKVERVVLASADLLGVAELDRLPALLASLRALVARTKTTSGKPRATVRRATLRALFDGEAAKVAGAANVKTALLDAFAGAAAPTGLVRVPEVIGTLEPVYARGALLAALDALARAGAVELRPESGLQRMSDEDRARCLMALDGTPLSYARVIAS